MGHGSSRDNISYHLRSLVHDHKVEAAGLVDKRIQDGRSGAGGHDHLGLAEHVHVDAEEWPPGAAVKPKQSRQLNKEITGSCKGAQ